MWGLNIFTSHLPFVSNNYRRMLSTKTKDVKEKEGNMEYKKQKINPEEGK